MIRHHRVQMRPVAVRARFWVTESFSTGRAKSEMPAMTMAHWLCQFLHPLVRRIPGYAARTFMMGALYELVNRNNRILHYAQGIMDKGSMRWAR